MRARILEKLSEGIRNGAWAVDHYSSETCDFSACVLEDIAEAIEAFQQARELILGVGGVDRTAPTLTPPAKTIPAPAPEQEAV